MKDKKEILAISTESLVEIIFQQVDKEMDRWEAAFAPQERSAIVFAALTEAFISYADFLGASKEKIIETIQMRIIARKKLKKKI